jgi:hypothetical protein
LDISVRGVGCISEKESLERCQRGLCDGTGFTKEDIVEAVLDIYDFRVRIQVL